VVGLSNVPSENSTSGVVLPVRTSTGPPIRRKNGWNIAE
jgi:hypothetical protein